MHQGDIPLRFFLKCRFGLHGLEALFGLLDSRSDDARRHGVQVELQNGCGDLPPPLDRHIVELERALQKRAILRSTVKYTSHGTAMNERIMPAEAISIS